jgi:hypothetical protein
MLLCPPLVMFRLPPQGSSPACTLYKCSTMCVYKRSTILHSTTLTMTPSLSRTVTLSSLVFSPPPAMIVTKQERASIGYHRSKARMVAKQFCYPQYLVCEFPRGPQHKCSWPLWPCGYPLVLFLLPQHLYLHEHSNFRPRR